MKNFTNNFKQFTSRLSARWLIMALMMLVGTSSAWAAIYLKGSFNGWGTSNTFDGNGNCTITLNKGDYTFKIDDNGTWYGNGESITRSNCLNVTIGGPNGSDMKLKVDVTGSYKFYWNGYQKKLTVTYPPECTQCCDKVEIKHPWGGGGWTYKTAEKCDGTIYSLEAKYGNNGCNWKLNDGSENWISQQDSKFILVGSPSTGDDCTFSFNTSNNTITITKVVKCETLTAPTLTVTNVKKCNTDYTDGKITISGYDANTYTYVLKNSSNQTVNKTYSSGYSFTKDEIGTYKVTMTRKDGTQCEAVTSDSKEIKITDNTPAIGNFSVTSSTSSTCSETQVTLTATSVNGASYQWFLNNSSTAISGASSYQYKPTITTDATYKVVVSKTANSCTATKNASVSVTAIPVASTNNFDITIPENAVYNGQKHSATATVKSGITGMGAITVKHYKNDSEVDPIDAGDYVVKMSVAAGNSYCAMAETQIGSFTINKANQTTPTITANSTNICGKEATFAVSGGESTGNYSYTFDKNDANATREGTTLKATQSGSVTLKVKKLGDTNYNNSEEAVKVFNFTMPIENVTLSKVEDDKTTYCVGDKVEFKLNYNGPYPANYAWSGSAMGSLDATGKTAKVLDNGASWYIDFTEAKTYTIALSLTGCNTQSSNELSFTVNALPGKPTFDAIPAQCSSYTLPKEDKYQVSVNWYNANGNKITTVTQSGTYYAEAVNANNCTSTQRTSVEIIIDKTPTISGETFTQPGKQNKIELTVPAGITAKWSVSPEADLSVSEGNSTMFSAEKNGRYTITATNGTCSDTHVVTVADAFYVYMRQPKESETAYNNFYYITQNPEQGGDLFYKEYSSIPPAEGYTDYNKGGRAHDVILTDCDGYVWYGFKASAQLIDGTNYFTVHAPNKNGYDGWFTHTDITKPGKMTGDIYYIMGTEGNGNSGWKIEEASAPYAGPKVHASGSTTLGTDKFAALYVTDCSGKEIDAYQWEYCRTEDGIYQPYSSVCSYTFEKKDVVKTENSDAGQTNNIRPSELGYYRCKVTYIDGTTATSATEHILGSYSRSFTSNIPVLVVNTGGKGFPDCTDISGQTASRNASKFKEKRSVDVKIYEGGTLVYDRKARMNYRGSSSLNFVKKSYAFCPGDANCEEKDGQADYVKTAKLNMLGVGQACDKDWVLYAAAADPSLMRNRLVFDSYKAMTDTWGVNSRYVELIVDGVYKGVYVFMDKITVNANRVNITNPDGFIVKFDKTDKEDRLGGYNGKYGDEKTFATELTGRKDISTYDTSVDQLFEIEYPEKDDYKNTWNTKANSIRQMFVNFESALSIGDFTTVQQYIDYTSWADWFIINEYTKNVDAYRASCIFVYTGEAGAKIEARPLWDQELSFNNTATTVGEGKACNITSGLLVEHDEVYKDGFPAPFWFTGNYSTSNGQFTKDKYKGLLDDPCFVQVVKERWETHKADALSEASLQGRITEYYNDLADYDETTKTYAQTSGKTRETKFWEDKSRKNCDCSYDTSNKDTATGYYDLTIDNSKGTMDTWVLDDQRRAGLSTAIQSLTGTSMNIQFVPTSIDATPWVPVSLNINKSTDYDYTIESELDNLEGVIKEVNGNKITYRIPRPDDWGTGPKNPSVYPRNDIEYSVKATLNVGEGNMECGSSAAPSSTAVITLKDEADEVCN